MIDRMIKSFKFSFELFSLPKRELVFWTAIRAITSIVSPLMIPVIIRVMFDAIASEDMTQIHISSIALFFGLVICFSLSCYIYVYSDAWVMKSMYGFQTECLKQVIQKGNIKKRRERYSDGDVSNILNRSAWSLIQIWLHIFRLIAPFFAIIVLLIMQITTFWGLTVLLAFSVALDFAIMQVQSKKIYLLQNQIINVEGTREQTLKYIVENAEFISMYNIKEDAMNDVVSIRNAYWKLEWKLEKLNALIESATQILDGIYSIATWGILGANSLDLEAGKITATNTIFSNLRSEVNKLKKQVLATIGKIVPVEKQKELLESIQVVQLPAGEIKSEKVLEIKKLDVRFDSKSILKNIDLSISEGEIVAIVGENGAGKSTLLKVLCDIYYASGGNKNAKYSAGDIGYLPAEEFSFSLPVSENIEMGYKSEALIKKGHYKKILSCSGLGDELELQEKTPDSLSGGQRKRMSIARALINDDDLLVMDEPTASLDRGTAQVILENIMHMKKTIIYTTHNPDQIKYASRVVMIADGRIAFDGAILDFKKSKEYIRWCG